MVERRVWFAVLFAFTLGFFSGRGVWFCGSPQSRAVGKVGECSSPSAAFAAGEAQDTRNVPVTAKAPPFWNASADVQPALLLQSLLAASEGAFHRRLAAEPGCCADPPVDDPFFAEVLTQMHGACAPVPPRPGPPGRRSALVIGAGEGTTGTRTLSLVLDSIMRRRRGAKNYTITHWRYSRGLRVPKDQLPLFGAAATAQSYAELKEHDLVRPAIAVDAVLDTPVAQVFPALLEQHPDALVILSVRDPLQWCIRRWNHPLERQVARLEGKDDGPSGQRRRRPAASPADGRDVDDRIRGDHDVGQRDVGQRSGDQSVDHGDGQSGGGRLQCGAFSLPFLLPARPLAHHTVAECALAYSAHLRCVATKTPNRNLLVVAVGAYGKDRAGMAALEAEVEQFLNSRGWR